MGHLLASGQEDVNTVQSSRCLDRSIYPKSNLIDSRPLVNSDRKTHGEEDRSSIGQCLSNWGEGKEASEGCVI